MFSLIYDTYEVFIHALYALASQKPCPRPPYHPANFRHSNSAFRATALDHPLPVPRGRAHRPASAEDGAARSCPQHRALCRPTLHFHLSVSIYAFAAALELAAEPLYTRAQNELRVDVRARGGSSCVLEDPRHVPRTCDRSASLGARRFRCGTGCLRPRHVRGLLELFVGGQHDMSCV
ncbi:hypothetical protein EDB83DRAFT_2393758, partial [Lactarius deliciosus]